MTEEDRLLKLTCPHLVSGHRGASPRTLFRTLADHPAAGQAADFYGSGGAVAELETRVATLLGKERGLFVINGVTAQLAALKSHAGRAGRNAVALHPHSHVDLDEQNALERAAGIVPVRLGRHAPFGIADLEKVSEPLAAVVVELPLRRAGYLLPPLDDLRAISTFCRAGGIALHVDGARLWEAAAGYGVGLADLAALADSVYVSFYKGIGGLGGAVVAGTDAFIASLGGWKTRFGGNLFTAFPYAVAALAGLDSHLPAMPDYVERARALAGLLSARLLLTPFAPDVNAFQLLLPGSIGNLTERHRRFARSRGVWLFNILVEAPVAGHVTAEIVIGDGCRSHSAEQAAAWIEEFIAKDGL